MAKPVDPAKILEQLAMIAELVPIVEQLADASKQTVQTQKTASNNMDIVIEWLQMHRQRLSQVEERLDRIELQLGRIEEFLQLNKPRH